MKKTEFIKKLKEFEHILKKESHKYYIAGMTYQDIEQEVRLRLWKKCILYQQGKSSFNTWATKVMKNCIKNLLRDAKRFKQEPLTNYIPFDELEEHYEDTKSLN